MEQARHKKAVFLDIDGTLCMRDGTVPASTREALRVARENGHLMVLCSGRSRTQIIPGFCRESEFDGIIASAGANIYFEEKPVFRAAMDPTHITKMVDYFREYRMCYFLQAESGLYAEPWAKEETAQALLDLGRTRDAVEKILGGVTLTDHPEHTDLVEKCCYFRCPNPAAQVQADLGDYYDVIDSSYRLTRFCDGEITIRGLNKASGMETFLEHVGLTREDSIAFGDGPNDFEMLDYAQTGVCMGNGVEELKARADMVCGPIDEDGLAKAFAELGLLEPSGKGGMPYGN